MEPLFGKTLSELKNLAEKSGLPRYTGKQMADWLYKKHTGSVAEMTNLSKRARETLSEKYTIGLSSPVNVVVSSDGTKKYLFKTPSGHYVEAAYIPEKKRHTLCISSQMGCKMGCLFCMTGKQGFQGNLSTNEILNQIVSIPEKNLLTNIVYMGMGEPMDNPEAVMSGIEILTSEWGFAMSPRRITLSTIGLLPAMKTYMDRSDCHLAISLHSPFDKERKQLMPIQSVYPVEEVIRFVKSYDWQGQRRISFEYILFKGLNDTPVHVKELARLLNGLRCRINLIHFHEIPETPLRAASLQEMEDFRDQLKQKGIFTTIRRSRGQDIDAACGLLSTKKLLEENVEKPKPLSL
ncbi:MAG: 23S rRNA (adenine(2503)-C(2))-methyltransferase RlmN [Chlorobi bacterium]|nr:23S rRNA (adenine(2503)-C(2))-methyltransferase RlmN [Chlorobiota bacterium]